MNVGGGGKHDNVEEEHLGGFVFFCSYVYLIFLTSIPSSLNEGSRPRESVMLAKCEFKHSAITLSSDLTSPSSIRTVFPPLGFHWKTLV